MRAHSAHTLVVDNWVQVAQRDDAERDRQIAALFDQHFDGLCDLAYLIMGDRHMAEEIVMEALLKTFTGWGRIRDKRRSDVYLKRAVVNLCRSKIRRKVIEARQNGVFHRREERKAPDWDPDVHETTREVWEAVKLLPPRQRAAIVLHYIHALPESEIAEVLDCSVGTVRSQLSRARGKLKNILEPGRVTEAAG
jgi:RNA polymerase sigma-70 factor (sigma-E family)